jgi:hypothetical protein
MEAQLINRVNRLQSLLMIVERQRDSAIVTAQRLADEKAAILNICKKAADYLKGERTRCRVDFDACNAEIELYLLLAQFAPKVKTDESPNRSNQKDFCKTP